MSGEIILDVLDRISSSMMVWALIGLRCAQFLARELRAWFVTPRTRFDADLVRGWGDKAE